MGLGARTPRSDLSSTSEIGWSRWGPAVLHCRCRSSGLTPQGTRVRGCRALLPSRSLPPHRRQGPLDRATQNRLKYIIASGAVCRRQLSEGAFGHEISNGLVICKGAFAPSLCNLILPSYLCPREELGNACDSS